MAGLLQAIPMLRVAGNGKKRLYDGAQHISSAPQIYYECANFEHNSACPGQF
jgi:hypothetical protein